MAKRATEPLGILMLRCLIVAIAIAFLCSYAHGKGDDKKPSEDKRGTKEQPLVIDGIPTLPTKEQSESEQRYRNEQFAVAREQIATAHSVRDVLDHMRKETFWLTIALIVVGLGQIIVFWRQLGVMKQTIDMTISAESPSLSINFDNVIHAGPGNTIRPMVLYRFTNLGRTPALVTAFQDRMRFLEEIPAEPDFDGEELTDRPERAMTVAPNGGSSRQIQCLFAEPIVINAEDARRAFFLYGRVRYTDHLGITHVQGFGWRLLRPPVGFDLAPAGGGSYNYRRRIEGQ